MMNRLFLMAMLFFLGNLAARAEIPGRPSPQRLVNDFAGILSADEQNRLEQKLVRYNDASSTQIAVVTVKSLDGYAVEQYSAELALKWGIGQKGKNNGVLVLLAMQERQMRIEVGYGLEGVITDIEAKQIIENVALPEFRNGSYFAGLDKSTSAVMQLASGEFKEGPTQPGGRPETQPEIQPQGESSSSFWMIIIVLVIIFIFMSRRGGRGRGRTYGGSSLIGGLLGGLMSGMFRGSRSRGGFGNGGGFGGFGGGSFGGGGASGRW